MTTTTTMLGFIDDQPIWALVGAEGEGDDGGGSNDGGDTGGENDGDGEGGETELGDAGRQALDRERANVKRARDELRPWKVLAKEFGLNVEQVRERLSAKPDPSKTVDAEAIRRDADAKAAEKANARIVRAEVKALASELFADPADAALYLDLSSYEVDDAGDVDASAITDDLKAVLRTKPHLAKKKNVPNSDGGSRQAPPKRQGMDALIRNAARPRGASV